MSKYHVVAAEGWGIRVPYDVEAPTDEEAVQMIKDQELAVQTYSVIWERHADSGSAAHPEAEAGRDQPGAGDHQGTLAPDRGPRACQAP